MPLTPAALLAANGGELEPELFPGETDAQVATRLQGYLDDGYARAAALAAGAAQDAAAAAWAYHRAYKATYLRLSLAPASESVEGEGSKAYTGAQMAAFRALADEKLAEFTRAVTAQAPVEPGPVTVTMALPVGYRW